MSAVLISGNVLTAVLNWANSHEGLGTWIAAVISAYIGVLALFGPIWTERRKNFERLVAYRNITYTTYHWVKGAIVTTDPSADFWQRAVAARIELLQKIDFGLIPPELIENSSDILVMWTLRDWEKAKIDQQYFYVSRYLLLHGLQRNISEIDDYLKKRGYKAPKTMSSSLQNLADVLAKAPDALSETQDS